MPQWTEPIITPVSQGPFLHTNAYAVQKKGRFSRVLTDGPPSRAPTQPHTTEY